MPPETTPKAPEYEVGKVYTTHDGIQLRIVEKPNWGYVIEALQWRMDGFTSDTENSFAFCQRNMHEVMTQQEEPRP